MCNRNAPQSGTVLGTGREPGGMQHLGSCVLACIRAAGALCIRGGNMSWATNGTLHSYTYAVCPCEVLQGAGWRWGFGHMVWGCGT